MSHKKIIVLVLVLAVIFTGGCETIQNFNKEEYSLTKKVEETEEVRFLGLEDVDKPIIVTENGNSLKNRYYENDKISLTLKSNDIFEIKKWEINGSLNTTISDSDKLNEPLNFVITSDTHVTATYGLADGGPYPIGVSDSAYGSVRIEPDKDDYNKGEKIEIIPDSDAGYTFDYIKIPNHYSGEEKWYDKSDIPITEYALKYMKIEANFYNNNKTVITFKEELIEDEVRNREGINKPKGEIFKSHLDDVLRLDLGSSDDLDTLEDLAKFDNLEYLNLLNIKPGSDISYLDNKDKLKTLILSKNENLQNLSVISSLDSLEILEINDSDINQNSDVLNNSILDTDNLTNLKELHLEDNMIDNLEALKSFQNYYPNLEILNLNYNALTSISDMKNISNIRELYLNENNITTIDTTDIENMANLEVLKLANNSLDDISISNLLALPNTSSLKEIDISGNTNITNFNNLGDFTELNVIIARDAGITDITDAKGDIKINSLETLNLANNDITTVSALNSIDTIGTLRLSNNPLVDISALEEIDIDKLYLLQVPEANKTTIENTVNTLRNNGTDVRVSYKTYN